MYGLQSFKSLLEVKVQNLGNKRRYICKDPRQISGQRNISYTRYSKKRFTQIYRDLYNRDAMLVPTRMTSNKADGNQQKHLNLFFEVFISIKVILFLIYEPFT